MSHTNIASAIYCRKPGDGSAREQAASCQRVLGAGANFAKEYATKRYRSNCINWGILPFVTDEEEKLQKGTWVFISDVVKAVTEGTDMTAVTVCEGKLDTIHLSLGLLTEDEKQILKDGCLINYYHSN